MSRKLNYSRRELLQQTGMGLGAAVEWESSDSERAKACLVLYLWDGMSHIDTFGPKPNTPDNVRGDFQPIWTVTSNIQISEHLPKTVPRKRASQSNRASGPGRPRRLEFRRPRVPW